MNHWWFLFRLKQKLVLRAIAEAEALTSGEIRICISHKKSADPMTDAKAQFDRLNMSNTRERNGILFFIAPRSRNFAIIGDEGIHAKCGEAFWTELSALLSATFKQGQLTEGLINVVTRAGQLLAEHFPRGEGDRNELPDEIVRG